ncbi:MAG: leucine-rich repeat protein [Anaerovoracaceae bacterium]|jgi:hypothetical protein
MKIFHFPRLRAILLIILSVIISVSMISLPGTYVSAEDTVTYTDPATKLTFELAGDNTATLTAIDSSLTEVEIPSVVTKDGTDYTVTAVSAKSKKFANVKSIEFPSTVKTVEKIKLPGIEGQIVFPSGVGEISSFASGASSVKFPDTLKLVQNIDFPNVTSVGFPSSVTSINGTLRFSSVNEITIPGSVKSFGAGFSNCSNLETVTFSEGVETIENGSSFFTKCSKVKTVSFPDSLKAINRSGLFRSAVNLEKINWPDHEFTVKNNASMFTGCKKLNSLDLPACVTPDGKIGPMMFANCTNLKEINLGCEPTDIGYGAFMNCTSLEKSPDLSQVETMSDSVFSGCTKMTGNLEGGGIDLSLLNNIPNYAFKDTKITGADFSNGLSSIGKGAFQNTKIKSAVIPDSVGSIGQEAFKGAGALTNIKIGDGVETLDKSAFADCPGLKEIEIGSGISKIDDSAFSNCGSVEKATIHSSEDAVEVNDIGSLPHDEIIFTEASIGDVGDTISEGGPTLQEAVNEAENGGTVVLKKHVLLDKTLAIPENKTVTIRSENDKYIIRAGSSASLTDGELIEVGAGRTLILEDVTVQGLFANAGEGHGLIDVGGKLVLGSNALIRDTYLSENNSSAIRVSGEGAVLEMNDGSAVKHNKRSAGDAQKTAPIRVTGGAVFNMNGGSVTGNSAVDSDSESAVFCSAGVLLDDNAKMNMRGGTISENRGHRGSAVSVDGADLVIDGDDALIENNEVVRNNVLKTYCGGAVFAYSTSGSRNGSVVLKNGTLRSNKAYNVGGAIAIARDADFSMEGGLVEKNYAKGYGGGIYLYGDNLDLTKGIIRDNSCSVAGGGVYVEGNLDKGYATAHFSNAVVRGNSASVMGGGVWSCPTGRVEIRDYSTAVYENTATASAGRAAAGDDFALIRPKSDDSFINGVSPQPLRSSISETSFGGGQMNYYEDGSVFESYLNNARDLGSVGGAARYSSDSSEVHVTKDNSGSSSFALKSFPDERAKTLAESNIDGKLLITGNNAERGAGIGSNGGVIFDGGTTKKINIEKVWSGSDPTVDSVTIGIYVDGSKLDTVTLTAEDGWQAELTGLSADISAENITATEETSVEDFIATFDVTDSEDGTAINVTVTNTYSEPPLTPDTDEPQDEMPPGDSSGDDTPVTTTSSDSADAIPTGDVFPTAAGAAALASGLAAMIAAYMRRRRAWKSQGAEQPR